jgi:hypothetical protein
MTPTGHWAFRTQQLTTALSDPTQGDRWFRVTVNQNFPGATLFMGDYSNVAVTPTGVAAFWTDMREDATFQGVTGHSEDAYFALTSSLPGMADLNMSLYSALTTLDQWYAAHRRH